MSDSSPWKSRYWADYTSPEIGRLDGERLVAVLPVAAIEQHGPHLPLSVDATILDGLVRAAIPRLPDELPLLFLPPMVVGKSNEHSRFPGTLTLPADLLIRNWMELGACVAAAGVRRFVLFNSHGGQMSVMDIVTRDLRAKHDLLVVASNWFLLGLPPGMYDPHEVRHGIHGGDIETSLMLALAPSLVDMREARNFRSATEDFERDYRYISITPTAKVGWQTQDLNPQGACGNAAAATVEKGRQTLAYVADRMVEMFGEVARLPLSTLRDRPA